jgi:hypothetical protein
MRKTKLMVLSLTLILALALVAGCGGSDSKPQQQAQAPQAQMSMPTGDPMPMMKDMDKNLQEMMKQVKAGQMMDAQKSAGQIASLADKVMPHMTDNAMREQMKKAAYDLRDTMNGAKVDQTVVEGKMKTMQDVMAMSMRNLQSGAHKH